MNGNDLYNGVREIDEKYLEQYDAAIASEIPQKAKKHPAKWVTLAACLAFVVGTIMIIKDYVGPVVLTPGIESTSGSERNVDNFVSHAGDGIFSPQVYIPDDIPDELLVTSDLSGPVYSISGIIADPYSEENLTEEKKKERVHALDKYMDLTGQADYPIEFDIYDAFPYVKTDDFKITSFSSYFDIDTSKIVCLTQDSTDDDIISVICNDLYLYALLKFIGLQENNLYIYKETTPFYDDNDKNGIPTAIMTTYKICNYSDIPQQLSFNLNSNYIKFWVKECYSDNSINYSSVYGYYYGNSCTPEIDDYISYTNAVALINESENTISYITACTIIYIPLDTENTFEPCYSFYCKTDDKDKNVVVPLVNDGSTVLYR